MENKKSNLSKKAKNLTKKAKIGVSLKTKYTNAPIETSQLIKLFEEELRNIYWTEKTLTKTIPSMIKYVASPELVEALNIQLVETKKQLMRLDEVYISIDKKASAIKCDAMYCLIKEIKEITKTCETGAMRDSGIISIGQKIEHYKIAAYKTLYQFAETLGLYEASDLFQTTLNEDKATDEKLSEIAEDTITIKAYNKKFNLLHHE